MEQIKKTRGTWIIHVRENSAGRGTNTEDEKFGLAPNKEMPFCNEMGSTTDKEE